MKFSTKIAIAGILSLITVTLIQSKLEAVGITLNETDYEITTTTGSYDELVNQLEEQPWFGNSILAKSAATQVGNSLGLPTPSPFPEGYGPIFAMGLLNETIVDTVLYVDFEMKGLRFGNFSSIDEYKYAIIATEKEVPEPLTLLGTLMAGGIGVFLNKRVQRI